MENKQTILDELAAIAPNLKVIDSSNPFQVPVGYFEKVAVNVLTKIKHEEKAPVVSMRFAKKWFTYAAAVMVMGILVTGALLYSDKPSFKENDKYRNEDLSLVMNQVSDEELVSYLEENSNPPIEAIFVDHSEAIPTMSLHMEQLSNERLDEYLLENNHLPSIGFE